MGDGEKRKERNTFPRFVVTHSITDIWTFGTRYSTIGTTSSGRITGGPPFSSVVSSGSGTSYKGAPSDPWSWAEYGSEGTHPGEE